MPTDAEDLAADPGKNVDCNAQLVNALDDKSLFLKESAQNIEGALFWKVQT